MTTRESATRQSTAGGEPTPPTTRNAPVKGPASGSYARLGEVLTAAEIAHVVSGKACDELTDAEWTKVVRFASGKRLDQLPPQLQRLIVDGLLSSFPLKTDHHDILWTVTLSVEPDSKAALASEIRLLDSILTPPTTDISRKFCVFRSRAVGGRGSTTASGAPKFNTFAIPRYIATRHDHYVLADATVPLDRIGSGEHSVVFRARRESDGALVAIKVIHPQAPSLSFHKEYLTHRRFVGDENVLQAYEAGRFTAPVGNEQVTFPFMVLEYGDMTLAKLIEDRQSFTKDEESIRQPFRPHEKRFFSEALLSIVKTLHERRIIHRDIKPENLYLVVRDGTVTGMKIGDFGIARRIPAGSDKVVLGRYEGTPAFSPRTSIEKGEYDFYTDLFGYARTVACLEPGLFMTGIGQTTQRQVKQALRSTTRLQRQQGTTTRSAATLVMARRHMEKNLSTALFRLTDSTDPFVLFVILPILAPERYPYCPRAHEDLAPMAAAAYRIQDATDLMESGGWEDALAVLRDVQARYGHMPWYPAMSSDVSGLIRQCEDRKTGQP